MMSDATSDIEAVIHAHGLVPSLTVLSDLMLTRAKQMYGPLSEADEADSMAVSALVDLTSSEVLVLRDVRGLPGRPTVLVSLLMFPEGDLAFVLDHLAPLRVLGSTGLRRDALEVSVTEQLQRQLPREFRVALRPNQFHGKCNDIVIVGPDGRWFDIEARNRRSDIHDVLTPRDSQALARGHRLGITLVFVVPRCTLRFRRLVEDQGGVVIETNTYVVETEERREALSRFSWMCRAVELSSQAAPRIAAQIASVVLKGQVQRSTDTIAEDQPTEQALVAVGERELKDEIRRYISLMRSHRRLDRAESLHDSGVSTMEEAAELIGCSRRTLLRDLRRTGRRSPWSRGGPRR